MTNSISVNVFTSVYSIDPIQTIEFDTIDSAKDFIWSDENKTTPMEVCKGFMPISRNFPNMMKGTIDSRDTALELWKNGDSSWIMFDSPV